MAKKVILGTDIARDAFKVKVNENFTELYDKDVALEEQINSFVDGTTVVGRANRIEPQSINNLDTHDITGFFFYGINVIGAISTVPGILKHERFDVNFAYQTSIPFSTVGEQYMRTKLNGVWDAWKKILTDKQPDWITATLQNGWTGTLQYRKNQLGQLEIKTNTHITPGTLTAGTILATLPTGYRPAIDTPIVVLNYATNRAIAYLSIATDGNIKVCSDDTGIVAGNNLRCSAIMPT